MPNTTELYQVTHSSPELETVGAYLEVLTSPASAYNGNADKFLAVVGRDGKTNKQRIEGTYTVAEAKMYKDYAGQFLPIHVGTIFYIEFEKINIQSFATQGIEVVSTDEPAFKAAKLAELESDLGYFQINKPIHGELINGITKEIYPDLTVWIWCRSLSDSKDASGELKGQFFDLTPFIQKVTTCGSKNGVNFQITLPPLVCELEDNKWILKNKSISQYINDNDASIQGMGYVAESSIFHTETVQQNPIKASDSVLVRNQFLFHNIIAPNDLILIRFETLDMEKEQRYSDSQQYYIDKKNIAGRIYDMIGLVDENIQVVNPQTTDVSINISGRDLSKLLIEDGTYFYALENSQGMLKFAGQSSNLRKVKY